MIMSRLGRVSEFKISAFMLFSAGFFMLLYIVVTLFMANGYFDLRSKCSYQDLRIEAMRASLKSGEKALYRARQRVSLLNRHVDMLTSEKGSSKEPAGDNERKPEDESETEHSIPAGVPDVEIRDYGISRNGAQITVAFKLVNAIQEKGPVSGYVHIVAVDEKVEPHQLWSSPKVAIREGTPVDFKSGQGFSINRFRTMTGTYYFDSPETVPTSIRVFVYDRQGKLMLEKRYEVKIDT